MAHRPCIAVAGAVEDEKVPDWVASAASRSVGRQVVEAVESSHEVVDRVG